MMLPTLEMFTAAGNVCPACGIRSSELPQHMRPATDEKVRTLKRALSLSLSFTLNGCPHCGHLLAVNKDMSLRDLTRAEADELAASPDFPRVRERVLEAVGHLIG